MADWYEVQEEDGETTCVRATNTRTALNRGFRRLYGREYKVAPGRFMRIKVLRLFGDTVAVETLEKIYQKSRKKKTSV